MRRTIVLLAIIVVGSCSTAAAATLHVDTFNATTEGWVGGASPTFKATGGSGGGGFLEIGGGSRLATFNSDARWVGNFTAIGAQKVRVDLKSPVDSEETLAMRLVLFGPSSGPGDFNERWTSSVAQVVPIDDVWRTYEFSLAAADLAHVQGTSTYSAMMAGVVRVMLRHDPGEPTADGLFSTTKLGIDNVELAAGAPASIPGDFNEDGQVNGLDLSDPVKGFRVRFGVDLTGNDFLVWQRNLGKPVAGPAQAAVPEPASALLLVLAAFGVRRFAA